VPSHPGPNVSRFGFSVQFGPAPTPMTLQWLDTMRGPSVATNTSSGHKTALMRGEWLQDDSDFTLTSTSMPNSSSRFPQYTPDSGTA